MNISEDKIKKLISMASSSMGITEKEFKEKIKNKNFDDPKLNELLNDPKKARELLGQPHIKNLMNKLFEKE